MQTTSLHYRQRRVGITLTFPEIKEAKLTVYSALGVKEGKLTLYSAHKGIKKGKLTVYSALGIKEGKLITLH